MWIDTNTQQVYTAHADIRRACRASLPEIITDDVLAYVGFEVVTLEPKPAFNPATEVAEMGIPTQVAGAWIRGWVVRAKTPAEQTADNTAKEGSIRAQRNQLLRDSDYTQLLDSDPTKRGAWVLYRQDLRDVPNQAGFPWDVIWPTPPA